jgi:hypothetical protein
MFYIRISEPYRSDALLMLVKSGVPIVCLPQKKYGVREEHVKLLRRKRIPFKKLDAKKIRMPEASHAV